MARPIDEELVRLRMDNSDFVKKASESTSIFQKLKDAFSKGGKSSSTLDKSVKSAQQLGSAVKGVDMGALGKAVDMVNSRFSVMGQIASNVLSNITNRVTNAAMNVAKGLTMTPMIDGFQEYELNMNSIQTMLSNVAGATLPQVNAALAELNEYADRTIYSFADMTRNMGYFTTAGIGLKESSAMIKGISNLAAVSGSSSQQASMAMYQLSQAAASGTIRLMDWNSVVNAGMGGKKFQDALVQSGIKLGTLTGEVDNFRESLSDEWLTADVLLDTLTTFSEDEAMIEAATKIRTFTQLVDTMKESLGSGWGKTFELLLGDFEQSGEFFTRIGEMFTGVVDDINDKRNNLIKGFVDMGGRDVLIDGIFTGLEAIGKILSVIGNAWSRVFPPATAQTLFNMAEGFRSLMSSMTMNQGQINTLGTIFEGVFSALRAGITIVKEVARALFQLIPDNLVGDLIAFLSHVARIPIEFNKTVQSGGGIIRVIRQIGAVFNVVGAVLGIGVRAILQGILSLNITWNDVVNGMVTALNFLVNAVVAIGTQIGNVLSTLFEGFSFDGLIQSLVGIGTAVVSFVRPAFDGLVDIVDGVVDGFKSAFSSFRSFGEGIISVVQSIFSGVGSIGKGIVDVFTGIGTAVGFAIQFIGAAFDSIGSTLSAVGGVLEKVFSTFTGADVVALGFVGTLALIVQKAGGFIGVLKEMGSAFSDFLSGISEGPKGFFKSLTDGITSLTESANKNSLLNIAISLGILTAAVKVMEGMSYESIAKGLMALASSLGMMALSAKAMNGLSITGGGGLMSMAGSLIAISIAFKMIEGIDASSLAGSVLALTATMGALGLLVKSMSMSVIDRSSVTTINMLSFSLFSISSAIKKIGSLNLGQATQGVLAITTTLLALAGSLKIMNGVSFNFATVTSLIAIGAAINMMIPPILILAAIPIAKVTQGILAVSALMGVMSLASRFGGNMSGAAGIIAMAAAMNMLVIPVTILGSLPYDTVVQGLLSLGAALAGLTAVMAIGSIFSAGMVAFAGSMMMMAASLNMLMPPLITFSAIPFEKTMIGVAALSVALLALGGAAALVGTLGAPGLLAFSTAALMFGAATALIGIGAVQVAKGIGILVAAVAAGAAAMPVLASSFGLMVDSIAQNAGKLADMVIALIESAVRGILGGLSALITTAVEVVIQFAQTIADQAPRLVEAALQLITGILRGIEQGLPEVVAAAISVAVAFIDGFARGITENAGNIVDAVKGVIQALGSILVEFLASIFDNLDLPMGWGEKIAGQLRESNQIAVAAAKEGASDVTEAYKYDLESGADIIRGTASKIPEGAADGIESGTPAVESAGQGLRDSIKNMFSNLGLDTAMADETDGMIGSLKSAGPKAGEATKSIGDRIMNSLSEFDMQQLMKDMGMEGAEGLEFGLDSFDPSGFLDSIKGMVDPELFAELEESLKLDPMTGYNTGHDYGSATADGVSDGVGQVDLSSIPDAFESMIPEVDASAQHIIAAFKGGISQAEFEALGSSWGYDFSRGIWSAVGSDGKQHVTDAGVEMMYQLEQAIIGSGKLEALGELMGIDLSGGITQNGGQYMTQAGVDLLMALEAGLSPEQILAISELLGFDIANAIGTSGAAQGTASGQGIIGSVLTAIQNGNVVETALGVASKFTGGFPLEQFGITGTAAGNELQAGIDGVQITFGTLLSALGGMGGLGGMAGAILLALGQGKLIGGNIQTGIESTDVTGTGTQIVQDVTTEAVAEASNTGTETAAAMETSLNTSLGSIDLSSAATTAVQTFATAFSAQAPTVTAAGTIIANAVKSGIESVSLQASGTKLGTQFVTGVRNTQVTARAAGTTIANGSKSGIESVSLLASGTKLGTQFVSGVRSVQGTAQAAGTAIGNSAKNGAASVSLYAAGVNMALGMANGIRGGAWAVYNAANSIANEARRIINRALRMRSPSRAMAESGLWFSQGFAMGISNGEGEVVSSAKDVALAAQGAVSTLASAINDTLNDEVEFSPTITPVLDDSNLSSFTGIQNGYQKVVRMADYSGFEDTDGRLLDKLRLENSRGAFSENESKIININNERLLDGATFVVREEADINKIVTEVDTHMRREAELELLFNVGKGG